MIQSAYIHIPFCEKICAYCDFFRCGYNPILVHKWLKMILQEIADHKLHSLKTLYIGGGTPSVLTNIHLETLLQSLSSSITQDCEFTMEANVSHLTKEKLQLMKQYGINRISLGVQCFNDEILQRIGRTHTLNDVIDCINRIHEIGIHNISIDLIYGLPNQSFDIWKKDLALAIQLPISHISLYALTIETNSRFAREHVSTIDASLDADMYEYACKYLSEHGFEQYEISSFARNQQYSQHNLAYWNYDDFYGIGCGASGKMHHMRYDNTKNFMTYLQKGASPEYIPLSKSDEQFEMIMMSLRKKKGLKRSLYQKRFDHDVYEDYQMMIDEHIKKGNIILDDDYMYASEKGFPILNDILVDFL